MLRRIQGQRSHFVKNPPDTEPKAYRGDWYVGKGDVLLRIQRFSGGSLHSSDQMVGRNFLKQGKHVRSAG